MRLNLLHKLVAGLWLAGLAAWVPKLQGQVAKDSTKKDTAAATPTTCSVKMACAFKQADTTSMIMRMLAQASNVWETKKVGDAWFGATLTYEDTATVYFFRSKDRPLLAVHHVFVRTDTVPGNLVILPPRLAKGPTSTKRIPISKDTTVQETYRESVIRTVRFDRVEVGGGSQIHVDTLTKTDTIEVHERSFCGRHTKRCVVGGIIGAGLLILGGYELHKSAPRQRPPDVIQITCVNTQGSRCPSGNRRP